MARHAKTALGSYTTPYGTAHFRVEVAPKSTSCGMAVRGSTATLSWLFPKKQIKNNQQRMVISMPPEKSSMEDVEALFPELVKTWNQRMARESSSWTARQGPLGSSVRSTVTMSDLIQRMETHAATHVRPSTLTTYRFEWQQILRMLPPSTPVSSITTALLLDLIGRLQRDGAAKETVRKHIAQLKRMCKFAITEGLITSDPSTSIKLPKIPRNLPRFLSQAERDRLLAVAEAKGKDYHLLIALGVFLGLRKAELNALRWQDIDFTQGVVHVVNTPDFTTKSGKPRTVPITDALQNVLKLYRQIAGFVLAPKKRYRPGARYRWEFRDVFHDLVVTAKLDPRMVTPHAMRHTFASILAQRGVSLYKIRLGWGIRRLK